MSVLVKLSVLLRKYVPGYDDEVGLQVEYEEGMTVEDVTIEAGVPVEKVIMVVVNQKPSKIGNKVSDGDLVRLAMVFGAG